MMSFTRVLPAAVLAGLLSQSPTGPDACDYPRDGAKSQLQATFDADGTAHVTRIVPVPLTISPEAKKMLARPVSDAPKPQSIAEQRAGTDKWQAGAGEVSKRLYPVKIDGAMMAGVPVRVGDADRNALQRIKTGC